MGSAGRGMNILLLASHAVAEYDDLRMFTDLGYDCFAPGGYEFPSQALENMRPALPNAPSHPELVQRLYEVRSERGEPGPAIDWGQAALHDDIIDWADVIIVHHFPDRWIAGQWDRIKHKRVIWRTCGQSDPRLEQFMAPFVLEGMEIVRYSPRERIAFGDNFAGEHAVIRFGKYPADYGPYKGDWTMGSARECDVILPFDELEPTPFVGNLTQDMAQRGDMAGLWAWREFTAGLPTAPAGKGSGDLEPTGLGMLPYETMLRYLAGMRVYFYTGTVPASYTLNLIEAMLSGTPVVTVGPKVDRVEDQWIHMLDESGDIAPYSRIGMLGPDVFKVYLANLDFARERGEDMRQRAVELFDVATIGQQWREFLS